MMRENAPSRTDTILEEIRRQLNERRANIDSATDLWQVTVTVKLHGSSSRVRGVVWEEERLCRSRT